MGNIWDVKIFNKLQTIFIPTRPSIQQLINTVQIYAYTN